jgi:antitoxin VapB
LDIPKDWRRDAHQGLSIQSVSGGSPPKTVVFPEKVTDVTILRDGVRRVIVPSNRVWDDFFDSPAVDLGERDEPEDQTREGF